MKKPETDNLFDDGLKPYKSPRKSPAHKPEKDMRLLQFTRSDAIPVRAATWLWRHEDECWLGQGGLWLLGGREGTGKSQWTCRLAAQVSNGTMEGVDFGKPRGVIIVAQEDAWEYTILPRLIAAGADLSRVYRLDVTQGMHLDALSLPNDVTRLQSAVEDMDIGLIILDPILPAIDGKLDTHKDGDVRKALTPLAEMAAEMRATVIGLIHQNKSSDGDLMTKLMGSRALPALARGVLVCAEEPTHDDPDCPRTFVLAQMKNNIGRRVNNVIRYMIESEILGLDQFNGVPIETSKVKIVDYKVPMDVDIMVQKKENDRKAGGKNGGHRTKAEQCSEWLTEYLSDGPIDSKVVKAEALRAGFNGSAVQGARALCYVVIKEMPRQAGVAGVAPTSWQLPDAAATVTVYGDKSE